MRHFLAFVFVCCAFIAPISHNGFVEWFLFALVVLASKAVSVLGEMRDEIDRQNR